MGLGPEAEAAGGGDTHDEGYGCQWEGSIQYAPCCGTAFASCSSSGKIPWGGDICCSPFLSSLTPCDRSLYSSEAERHRRAPAAGCFLDYGCDDVRPSGPASLPPAGTLSGRNWTRGQHRAHSTQRARVKAASLVAVSTPSALLRARTDREGEASRSQQEDGCTWTSSLVSPAAFRSLSGWRTYPGLLWS